MGRRRTTIMIDDEMFKKLTHRMANRIAKTSDACSFSTICNEVFQKEFKKGRVSFKNV